MVALPVNVFIEALLQIFVYSILATDGFGIPCLRTYFFILFFPVLIVFRMVEVVLKGSKLQIAAFQTCIDKSYFNLYILASPSFKIFIVSINPDKILFPEGHMAAFNFLEAFLAYPRMCQQMHKYWNSNGI